MNAAQTLNVVFSTMITSNNNIIMNCVYTRDFTLNRVNTFDFLRLTMIFTFLFIHFLEKNALNVLKLIFTF